MIPAEELPHPEDALARAHAACAKMAAALNEDLLPEPDEPLGWQPVWKRPRKLKSKADAAARRDARALSRVWHSSAWLW
ncbi:hypothetical protein [Streptomyces sp. NPDC054887]